MTSSPTSSTNKLALVIFDKDGTLVDVDSTWAPALTALINELAAGDEISSAACMSAIGVDAVGGRLIPGSPSVWASNDQLVHLISESLPLLTYSPELVERVERFLSAAVPETVQALPCAEQVLHDLLGRGIALALATNDGEESTRAQLAHLGWEDHFAFVVGYDSGWGAKPAPDMLLACLRHFGCAATEAVMVGDSSSDVLAANRAQIRSVFVGIQPTDGSARAEHRIEHIGQLLSPDDGPLFSGG